MTSQHLWIVGPQAPRPDELPDDLPGSGAPLLAAVSAHRRRRGPYTAAGEVARSIAAPAAQLAPQLMQRYDVEAVTVAPELRGVLAVGRDTLTSLSSPQGRTRYYPRVWTTRIAHGVTELLTGYVRAAGGPRHLLVTDVDEADPTDTEWLGILLRRTDPELLTVVVHSRGTDLPDPLGEALRRYARRAGPSGPPPRVPAARQPSDPAAAFVASDCLSDDPRLRAAYEALAPGRRAALHDERATELEAVGESSLRLGAIPYHRERGADPRGAGAAALLTAIEHCVLHGFYDAVLDLGERCFAVLDWHTRPGDCWLVTAKVTTALTALDRADDAAACYDEACAASTLPSVHLQAAYGRAMLYTRFYEKNRQDHLKAKAWVNTAIAISALLPDEQRRAFNLTFNENGLALVEMHLGDLAESRRLVEAGMARLDADAGNEEHVLHRSVLQYNRAQLLAATGPVEEALAEYTAVIERDPHHSEYYFERAGLFRRAGRHEEAMADYEAAMRESPPYPEPYYNHGDLALEAGDLKTALADFSYVLELEPTFVDALVNRAGVRYQLGDLDGAAADVEAGLALEPGQAHLHCQRGLIEAERGDATLARAAFDAALGADPDLVPALANRAVLAFEAGEVDAAIRDLTRALELADDPALRGNRAIAYEAAGRLADAVADCEVALAHPEADREELTTLRDRCAGALAGEGAFSRVRGSRG